MTARLGPKRLSLNCIAPGRVTSPTLWAIIGDNSTTEVPVKTILCYGDSNTWGYVPATGQRHPRNVRWPGVLQAALGPDFHVVEEGLNGRTTVLEDPSRLAKNGLTYLRPCLDSHAPLDLLILMLGTNDLKNRFGLSAADVAVNIAMMLHVVRQGGYLIEGTSPPVLLISPPHVGTAMPELANLYAGADVKSRQLARHYKAVADKAVCVFLDAAEVRYRQQRRWRPHGWGGASAVGRAGRGGGAAGACGPQVTESSRRGHRGRALDHAGRWEPMASGDADRYRASRNRPGD